MSGSEGRKNINDIVRHFSPAWFAVIMGTGSISILFRTIPYGLGSQGMKTLSLAFFFLDICLFIICLLVSVLRYTIYPETWGPMIRHPSQSLYACTFPMGAVTILTTAVSLIHEDYGLGGKSFLYVIWWLWWIDVACSFLCCFGVLYCMQTVHVHTLQTMTTIWLLPVVTLVVASSAGGIIALSLYKYSLEYALVTITSSIFMLSIGLSLALMLLTMYLLRLIVHGLPSGSQITSVFLPLGPMGQAGYSILLLGQFFRTTLPLPYGSSELLTDKSTGRSINVFCTIVTMILWSLASMWLFFALLGLQKTLRQTSVPFRLQIWGIIFPNGVYANLTLSLASTFDSSFFRIWGTTYAVATILTWCLVASRTVALIYSTQIFEVPSANDLDAEETWDVIM
ncbi:voltage-dependent anion channel [Desarmillaria tabescens]|uniref:Voltage-dependent anion channel n=1 Tax=Armillaria tabescens TaxID=1929756 RepID=A0AA39KAS1_ARMTA|nr:voltage-dependent anion channel [Desarmillaria tabescens]KAK0455353.1 voltage-dependent anion channel [Desarmillaria tabescens]